MPIWEVIAGNIAVPEDLPAGKVQEAKIKGINLEDRVYECRLT